ncbi:MAG: transposase [Tardiphaga sp.]|nr:transposase [Tardiphaga sp.]
MRSTPASLPLTPTSSARSQALASMTGRRSPGRAGLTASISTRLMRRPWARRARRCRSSSPDRIPLRNGAALTRGMLSLPINYLIDLKAAIIVDVEATRAIRQAEVGAARTMIDRTVFIVESTALQLAETRFRSSGIGGFSSKGGAARLSGPCKTSAPQLASGAQQNVQQNVQHVQRRRAQIVDSIGVF